MSIYYDLSRILTHNALITMILGGRGIGKTFSAKDWAVRDFINTEGQFVWVRRYETEFINNKRFWKDTIKYGPYEDHTLTVDGMNYLIDGKPAGFGLPLSTSKIQKGDSFPDVNKIIFDEVLLEQGVHHYLPGEVDHFLNLLETVGRTRDPRAILLSNSITVTNPYFLYWDIVPRKASGVVFKKASDQPGRPLIVVEFPEAAEYQDYKKKTRFGQLIAGTPYGEYAINNKFLLDSEAFICRKTEHSRYSFGFRYKGRILGVWVDYQAGRLTVSEDVDPSAPMLYTLTKDDHEPNTLLIGQLGRSPVFKLFLDQYERGNVYFENMNIKNNCYQVFKLFNMR